MAIQFTIPEIWSARLLMAFDKANAYMVAVTDRSGELAMGGDRLHMGEITSTVTVGDYVKDTDMNPPEAADDADEVLMLDQQKYFNIQVDDLDRVQARPDLLDEFARKAAVAIADTVNAYIYGVHRGAVTEVTGTGARPARLTTIEHKAAEFGNLEYAGKLVEALIGAMTQMDRDNIPQMNRYAVATPEIRAALVRWLLDKGVNFNGDMSDTALMDGMVSRAFGFNFAVDNVSPAPGVGTRQQYIAMGHPEAVVWASQINRVEPYRPEARFADAIKGLYVYGAHAAEREKMWAIEHTLS